MNRRNLLKGVAGLTAGLILPPTLTENVEAARRYWAIGAMPSTGVLDGPLNYDALAYVMSGMFGKLNITEVDGGSDSRQYRWEWTTPNRGERLYTREGYPGLWHYEVETAVAARDAEGIPTIVNVVRETWTELTAS